MELRDIFNFVLMILVSTMGFIAKVLHSNVNETSAKLADFKTHVAENYVHNTRIQELKDLAENTNKRVDEIYLLLTKRDR